MSREHLDEMAGWISDAFENTDVGPMSDDRVQSIVDRHYEGGVEQFIRDQQG